MRWALGCLWSGAEAVMPIAAPGMASDVCDCLMDAIASDPDVAIAPGIRSDALNARF